MLVDLTSRLDESNIRDLLAYAIVSSTAEKVSRACWQYLADPCWTLFGLKGDDDQIIACIGIEQKWEGEATLQHLAVHPDHRWQGTARCMLDEIGKKLSLRRLDVETEEKNVEFYRRSGFTVQSIEFRYPGIERYRCERVWI